MKLQRLTFAFTLCLFVTTISLVVFGEIYYSSTCETAIQQEGNDLKNLSSVQDATTILKQI